MKNIIVRSGSLRMGGLEKVLIEFLKLLDTKKYRIFLFIEDDCEDENIFQKDIPINVELFFLKDKKIIEKTKYFRERKKNIIYKILYNIYMQDERRIVEENTIKTISILKENYGAIDLFIDYDWGATKYIEKLQVNTKIVWLHNSVENLMKKKSKINRFGKRLKKYDGIVTICNEMKNEVENLYPFIKNKVHMIYNPFDFNQIQIESEKIEDLNDEDKELIKKDYILAVSRLDTVQKDYDTLLKAYRKSLENGDNNFLYIIGDGPNSNDIKIMVKDLKLDDKVVFLGRRKNPYIWMKKSKFFVHSSKYEGFGLVLVEAMSLGKCVISSNCQVGPKEILENGNSGLLFNVGDIVDLKIKIIEISKNEELRMNYERKALISKNRFSGEVIKIKIDELIGEIIK